MIEGRNYTEGTHDSGNIVLIGWLNGDLEGWCVEEGPPLRHLSPFSTLAEGVEARNRLAGDGFGSSKGCGCQEGGQKGSC